MHTEELQNCRLQAFRQLNANVDPVSWQWHSVDVGHVAVVSEILSWPLLIITVQVHRTVRNASFDLFH